MEQATSRQRLSVFIEGANGYLEEPPFHLSDDIFPSFFHVLYVFGCAKTSATDNCTAACIYTQVAQLPCRTAGLTNSRLCRVETQLSPSDPKYSFCSQQKPAFAGVGVWKIRRTRRQASTPKSKRMEHRLQHPKLEKKKYQDLFKGHQDLKERVLI